MENLLKSLNIMIETFCHNQDNCEDCPFSYSYTEFGVKKICCTYDDFQKHLEKTLDKLKILCYNKNIEREIIQMLEKNKEK